MEPSETKVYVRIITHYYDIKYVSVYGRIIVDYSYSKYSKHSSHN